MFYVGPLITLGNYLRGQVRESSGLGASSVHWAHGGARRPSRKYSSTPEPSLMQPRFGSMCNALTL